MFVLPPANEARGMMVMGLSALSLSSLSLSLSLSLFLSHSV
jgi:hypothetical protein